MLSITIKIKSIKVKKKIKKEKNQDILNNLFYLKLSLNCISKYTRAIEKLKV